jgi:hypothetical protein
LLATIEALDERLSSTDAEILETITTKVGEINNKLTALTNDYLILLQVVFNSQVEAKRLVDSAREDLTDSLTAEVSRLDSRINTTKTDLEKNITDVQTAITDNIASVQTALQEETALLEARHSNSILSNRTAINDLAAETRANNTKLIDKVEALTAEVNTNKSSITTNKMSIKQVEAALTNKTNSIDTDISTLSTRLDAQSTRISSLMALPDGSTADKGRLEDICIGYDYNNNYAAKTYASPGDAVRAIGDKIKQLENDLPDFIPANNVDNLHYENNQLYLMSGGTPVGDPVTITGGGGTGESTGYVLLLKPVSPLRMTVAKSSNLELLVSFYEKYDGATTGVNGTLEVSYKLSTADKNDNFILYKTYQNVAQDLTATQENPYRVDVTDILSKESTELFERNTEVPTTIRLEIIGGASGNRKHLDFTVKQVKAGIAPYLFNSAEAFTGNIYFQYTCSGNVEKTVYFELDDDTVPVHEEYIGTDQGLKDYTIPMLGRDYGVHTLKVYFKTPEGATSNILQYSLLYDNGTSKKPIVSVSSNSTEVVAGEPISGTYVVYTPDQETTDKVTITVWAYDNAGEPVIYDEQEEPNVQNEIHHTWSSSKYPTSGKVYITFKCENEYGKAEDSISIDIKESQSGYNLDPVTTGLIYAYTASGRSNTNANKDLYEYDYTAPDGTETTVQATFDGFNWLSNGYLQSEDALTLSGDAKHTIKLPIFANQYTDKNGKIIKFDNSANASVTTRGRTFEIEFKVSNVTNINAPIIKCMDTTKHAGFVITPQICYLLASDGADIKYDSTGFIENEATVAAAYIKDNTRIRVSFVIEPVGAASYKATDESIRPCQCINIYINGQFANSLPYTSATFAQNNDIEIGSNTCITKIYDVRIYNRGLSAAEILQNYKASPVLIKYKIARFADNDVLTQDSTDVDYYKAIKKYPCLLITGPLAPYKDALGRKYEYDSNGVKKFIDKTDSGVTLTKPDGAGSYTTEFNLLDKNEDGVWVCSNNVQGTSSVKFPVKNYKVYLVKALFNDDGSPKTEEDEFGNVRIKTKKVKYSLKGKDPDTGEELSIGESTLCWKGDYMSSDHANTFNANLADTLFGDILDSQNPAKGGDSRVQNTVYGFRCLLFQRDDETSPIKFAGDGALNNDKGNTKTFGLEVEGDEIAVSAKIGKVNLDDKDIVCLQDAKIVSNKEQAIDFVEAENIGLAQNEGEYTVDSYIITGVLSFTNDFSTIDKCLVYEDTNGAVHTMYLLSLTDEAGTAYEAMSDRPKISDCGNLSTRQKWEFANNTDSLCTFTTDRFFEPVNGKWRVVGNLESTYPDEGDLNDEGLTPKYDCLQTLYTWVYQRANFWDASAELLPEPKVYGGQEYDTEKAYRKAIFINEFEKHFNKNHALVYYLFCEFTALCDNRAKNMFLRSEDILCEKLISSETSLEISIMDTIDMSTGAVDADMIDWEKSKFATWITDLYDLDSCFGVENSGYLQIPYYAEWDYTLDGTAKFNGLNSRLWLMFEEAFADSIEAKAQELTKNKVGEGGLNYDALYKYHIEDNALNVCPAVINKDMTYKYNEPWVTGYVDYSQDGNPFVHFNGYKYLQRGSRTEQKDAFIYRRSNMLYSKYLCDNFLNNNINFRCGADGGFDENGRPYGGLSVADSDIELTANQVLYPAIKFGDGSNAIVARGDKTTVGNSAAIKKPGGDTDKVGYSDTIYLAGGSFLTDIGDISKYYPYEVRLEKGGSLKTLTIGSAATGYKNENLQSLALEHCPLLEKLNILGCTKLEKVDLTKNNLLKELYSDAKSVELPEGGILEKMYLGEAVDLVVLNQPKLTEFKCSSYNALAKMRIENTPKIPALQIVLTRGIDKFVNGLRLVGIDASINTSSDMEKLMTLTSTDAFNKYLNLEGKLTDDTNKYPHITGIIHIDASITVSGAQYNELKKCYPELILDYKNIESNLIFMDGSGEGASEIEDARQPIANGGNGANPSITLPDYSDAQYEYKHIGWSTEKNVLYVDKTDAELDDILVTLNTVAFNKVIGDRILYPVYKATTRTYTVKFINPTVPEGDVGHQCDVQEVPYGGYTEYTKDEPKPGTLLGDLQNAYEFTGWDPRTTNYPIAGDTTFTAQFAYIDSDTDEDELPGHTLGISDLKKSTLTDGFVTNNDQEIEILKVYNQYNKVVVIPEYIMTNGKNCRVVSIGSATVIGDIGQLSSGFAGYTGLLAVELPKSVTQLQGGAFNGCTNLVSINLGEVTELTKISDTAFNNCSSLKTITIPENVISIGAGAFSGCRGLTKFDVSENNLYFSTNKDKEGNLIGNLLFYKNNDDSYKVITGTSAFDGDFASYTPEGVTITTIAESCFEGMGVNIKTVTIPSTVTEISSRAFRDCTNLTTVNLPTGLSAIPASCFSGCASLTTVNNLQYNNNLTTISTYAFNKTSLTDITIPSSVTTINDNAFGYITSLSTVTFKGIPGTITSNAFNCAGSSEGLTFYVPGTKDSHNSYWDNVNGGRAWGAQYCKIVLEDGTIIGGNT